MLLEVMTFPKPGLVSHVDSGSHDDMTAATFRASAAAIRPFMARLAEAGSRLAPMPVATGEHVQNRVVFKQMLQAKSLQVLQMDACRVGGINENIAILLLAEKFGVPVIPHAGGVGLCETVQHMSMFDFTSVSTTMDGRMIEFADHLHEHFVNRVSVVGGRYRAPTAAGTGAEMSSSSIDEWTFPGGSGWVALNS